MVKPVRRRCKNDECREWFLPAFDNQWWCSPECRSKIALERRSKELEKAADKKLRREEQKYKLKIKKRALNPRSYWLKQAQAVFNSYIRERDAGQPCISCGTYYGDQCSWDAWHYRTVAAAGHIRFNEDNCHRQCRHCNQTLDGNIAAYRRELVRKIGLDRVEALENNNDTHKWTIEECKEIIKTYQEKLDVLRGYSA